ncbi:hypothetical protein GCM10009558_031450 [Virgisporangium aurantiacum]
MRALSRLELLRYAGFGATCLIAAGAYGAGALASGDPAPTLRVAGLASTTAQFRIGLVLVLAGSAGLIAVWWRLSDAIPVRTGWLATTGLLWAVPLLLAPPLASRDVYSYACQGWLYGTGQSPYRVSPLDGHCPWTDAVAPTWLDTTAPYGAAGIAATAVAALPSRLAPADVRLVVVVTVLRMLVVAAILLAAVAGARLAKRCGVLPGRAATVGLATPLVALHGVSGAHLDVVVLALVIGGQVPGQDVLDRPFNRPFDRPGGSAGRRRGLGERGRRGDVGLAVVVQDQVRYDVERLRHRPRRQPVREPRGHRPVPLGVTVAERVVGHGHIGDERPRR